MLAAERKQWLVDRLHRDGKIVAAALAGELHISEDTLRRDLRELAEAGLLLRVHGGALPVSPAAQATYNDRQQQAPQAKIAIARAAVGLLRPGQVVMLDGGTTALQVAQHIPIDMPLTVITTSPPIAVALGGHSRVDVHMLSGKLLKRSLVVCGPDTVAAIQQVRADVCFLGVCSLHPEAGITVPEYDEVHVKRAMLACAAETVALASAEKLGTASTYVVAPVRALAVIITDANLPAEMLKPYRLQGLTLIQS